MARQLRQVNTQHLIECHHLSVNEAVTAAASCSLAKMYQCFNDSGLSYN